MVIGNEKTYLSISDDYGLIETYIYFRVIVLVKSYVYYPFNAEIVRRTLKILQQIQQDF